MTTVRRAAIRRRRSARWQLLGLWLLLAVSASITAYLLVQFYWQTTARQVSEANEVADRACRTIGDRYRFFTSGWSPGPSGVDDAEFQQGLLGVVSTALARIPGVEGGVWQAAKGSLAYAFPTYEGSGPKTDLPNAELSAIAQVNRRASSNDGPETIISAGRAQTVVLHACPLPGPVAHMTAWTMLRVYSWSGPAYNRLVAGMGLLAATVAAAAVWLALVIIGWSRRATRIASILKEQSLPDLPQLEPTGDPDMDHLVTALNEAGDRLAEARRRAEGAERLAAVGRLSAGLAHEVRNPLAAIRLKAENALAADSSERADAALKAILQQVARLDRLLSDLLATTHQKPVVLETIDARALFSEVDDTNGQAAANKGVHLTVSRSPAPIVLFCDREQMCRALDNLVVNAIGAVETGGSVALSARRVGDRVVLRVADDGPGVDPAIADRVFEPFVTGRSDGTGLGLAIVREIARAHGGDARLVASSQGAAFEIEVPCPAS